VAAAVLAVVAVSLLASAVRAQGTVKLEIVPQIPHSSDVTSVAFSPDGARVLSGSQDNTLKLWQTAGLRL
jgi:WD40 repeat protein